MGVKLLSILVIKTQSTCYEPMISRCFLVRLSQNSVDADVNHTSFLVLLPLKTAINSCCHSNGFPRQIHSSPVIPFINNTCARAILLLPHPSKTWCKRPAAIPVNKLEVVILESVSWGKLVGDDARASELYLLRG